MPGSVACFRAGNERIAGDYFTKHLRRRRSGMSRFVIAFAVVFAAATVRAQVVGGSIGGTVTDDTGGALPGVTITVTNTANGTSQTVTTGERGNYRAVALQPAPYAVTAELSGFATLKREIVLTI